MKFRSVNTKFHPHAIAITAGEKGWSYEDLDGEPAVKAYLHMYGNADLGINAAMQPDAKSKGVKAWRISPSGKRILIGVYPDTWKALLALYKDALDDVVAKLEFQDRVTPSIDHILSEAHHFEDVRMLSMPKNT